MKHRRVSSSVRGRRGSTTRYGAASMRIVVISSLIVFPYVGWCAECATDLDQLVSAIVKDDRALAAHTDIAFHTTELFLDDERRPVDRRKLDAEVAREKYGRAFPSEEQQKKLGLSVKANRTFFADRRNYFETQANGWLANSYWFVRKESCWVLASREVFLRATDDDIRRSAEKTRDFATAMVPVPNLSIPRERRAASTPPGRAESDLRSLNSALQLFRLDSGRFPTAEEGVRALVAKPIGLALGGGYLDAKALEMKDPWGRSYIYLTEPCGHFVSYGEDAKRGGEGLASDIGGCIAP